jgi:hypothetical protein
MTFLRFLCGALFLCGCPAALIAWMWFLNAARECNPFRPCPLSLRIMCAAAMALIASGYLVWMNWLSFALRGKSFLLSPTSFQRLSVVNHLGWLVFWPVYTGDWVEYFYDRPVIGLWFFMNIVIGLAVGGLWAAEASVEPPDAMDSR